MHWYRYGALRRDTSASERALNIAITMFTPCFINDIDPLPEPLLPILADQAAPIAVDLFDSAFAAPDEAYLRVAIRLLQRILAIRPADRLSRPAMLSMLGIALSNLSERTGDQATLDEAVDALREAAAAIPADDAAHAETLSNLGNALRKRFELTIQRQRLPQ
ncbi:MAG: hypothetical protein ABR922_25155 [Streptosporangiaceae bacterium]